MVASSVVNTDGHKSGMTVPNVAIQAELLRRAYSEAEIHPDCIDYIEAHGTGTPVGDPIETQALGTALGQQRSRGNPLPIGSVKSNLGHLEPAAGVAGLVKSLLCIEHRTVPATTGITGLNPNIPFEDLNLDVVREIRSLKSQGRIVIGVNSFGFGGANAHVVLLSAEPSSTAESTVLKASPLPLLVTANSESALKAAAGNLAGHLIEHPGLDPYDLTYHAAFRRDRLRHRALLFGTDCSNYAEVLLAYSRGEKSAQLSTGTGLENAAGPVFVYSGNGSQWFGMGKKLLTHPVFKATVAEVDKLFRQYADWSITAELAGTDEVNRYEFTEVAQPTLFAIQVGMTRMLDALGIRPLAVVGHSVGEIAAAWGCGALSLPAAVQVIFHRSQMQGTTKGNGQMTAVGLGTAETINLLSQCGLDRLIALAGGNSPKGTTVAGPCEHLERFEKILTERNIFNRRLILDYAFHSPAMDILEAGLLHTLADLPTRPGNVPFYSTVSGSRLEGCALGAQYWWHNIRRPVLFEQAIGQIIADGLNVFIEIGPHPILRGYLNDCMRAIEISGRVITTGSRGQDDPQLVERAAGQAVIAGCTVDWERFFSQPGKFIDLPHYPWQRERHWHPITPESYGLLYRYKRHPLLGYPLPQRELAWENRLDTLATPSLADHMVDDVTVFPGAGFTEMALAAATLWAPGDLAEIEDLEIRSPLLLSANRSKTVRLFIDPDDGRFTVNSRDLGSLEPWNLNVTGRIINAPSPAAIPAGQVSLPARQPDFDCQDHYRLTSSLGLGYGPAFQTVGHGWIDGKSVAAVLQIPPVLEQEIADHHLHPALLDGTFQLTFQLLKEFLADYADRLFVPVRIGRITLRGGTRPHSARATLLRLAPHSLTAEFFIDDVDGNPIAALRQVRFRAIRVHGRQQHARPDFLIYRTIPAPHPLTADAASPAREDCRKLLGSVVEAASPYAGEVEPLLDMLCNSFAVDALRTLTSDGKTLSTGAVRALKDRSPILSDVIDFLLGRSVEDGLIEPTTAGFHLTGTPSAQAVWNDLVRDYPHFFHLTQSVTRTGLRLREVVAGNAVEDAHLSTGSLVCPITQALNDVAGDRIGVALRRILTAAQDGLPSGRRLRIIELGDGVPLAANAAAEVLDTDCSDYRFLSPNPQAIEECRLLLKHYPALQFQLFEPTTESATDGCHDLAIVTGNFRDPEVAVAAICNARTHLAANGLLLFLGLHPARWIDFALCLDSAVGGTRAAGQFISQQQPADYWRSQLEQLGFVSIERFDLAGCADAGPYLFLAQSAPAVGDTASVELATTRRKWLLVADERGASADLVGKLVASLRHRGATVTTVLIDDCDGSPEVLAQQLREHEELHGVVHLAWLNSAQSAKTTDFGLDRQVDRCVIARDIIKACETRQIPCWLVTSGAVTHLLPGAVAGESLSLPAFADAALWGFGRTLLNEVDEPSLRMVDLEPRIDAATAAAALTREFLSPGNEQEVILTAAGRFVPRLGKAPDFCENSVVPEKHGQGAVRLGFHMPGQLHNLRWEHHPAVTIAADELEIEVMATGLNFRDFMYTLGLLSDEAVENGFVGPTLGLEFAGVVIHTGTEVKGFAVGDMVMGFGPASFATRVITKAGAVAPVPPGIDFAAAATIPTAFFTVYYAMHYLARLGRGEKILIHGGAGGVGLAAIQVARWCGAEIYATAGNEEKRNVLRLLGIEHVYDSRSLDFAEEILAQTGGEGVDVVLNSLSGEAINRNLRVLKPFGRFLELGKRDFYENTRLGLRPFRNNISYFGIDADQLMKARPELTTQLFREILALFNEGFFHPLPYTTFDANQIVEAFRHMQQSRQIGKIVVTYRNTVRARQRRLKKPEAGLVLSAEATFLIIGGLNGFGLKTAEWLVDKGTKNLVLISRSGPTSEDARQAISRLKQAGVKVHAAACDVTQRESLASLLAEVAQTMPPLKGIVHSAMVIEDGLIRNLDRGQIHRVMAPKILGAIHLHELTRGLALDHFLIFSSATTFFGNPGQGNYIAANSWLEALASRRRSLGLPAICIALGAIDDVGYLARNAHIKEALQFLMGSAALTSATALAALEKMICADVSGLGVLELDWRSLQRFLPRASSPKFKDLAGLNLEGAAREEGGLDLARMLMELSESELQAALIDLLKKDAGEVLRIAPEKIDEERPLHEMGLDSLMGVELVVAVEARFGVKLPAMVISENPNLRKLADYFIQQLRKTVKDVPSEELAEGVAKMQQIMGRDAKTMDIRKAVEVIHELKSDKEL